MDTSTTAGYVDAAPLLAENLHRLGALRPGVPVLSLYRDLDPSEFGTQRARRSAYTSLLDEAHKRIEEHDTDHDGRASLRADLERVSGFLDAYRPKRGRGLAIFAASAAGFFEAHTLPRPPRTRVVIDDSPYVTPLLVAGDVRDWLIVLVDAHHARFLHGNTDYLVEFEHDKDAVAGQHEGQSTSDHQRWVEHQIDDNLKAAAAQVDRRLASGRFDRVLVGGPDEIASRFEQQHLSSPARERLAGRFEVDVSDTAPDDVRVAAMPCFEEHERRHERELLDRLAQGLGRGERAAAGVDDVRAMLEQARVETLLYQDGFASPDPGVLEQAIEDAAAQSAEIVPLRHHGEELERHGWIAALLRF
ncbi:MAG TPA: hypothetical protein VG474_01475 [Solirubrobacteraceae bacterium]|nr:hypothetical protein [Solirubrobacteraceae bacterium]